MICKACNQEIKELKMAEVRGRILILDAGDAFISAEDGYYHARCYKLLPSTPLDLNRNKKPKKRKGE